MDNQYKICFLTPIAVDINVILPCNLKLIDKNNKDVIVSLIYIQDDNQTILVEGIIEETNTLDNQIYVYGQEIQDFKSLTEKKLFIHCLAAVKKIDEELQFTKNELNTVKNNLKTVIEELNELKKYTII